jgi:large subunit ribosomal protein L25
MNEITIDVVERGEFGKNVSRRMRRDGLVPAILYGSGKAPVPLTVDPRRLEEVLQGDRGINTLFHLRLQGKDLRRMVRIREYQRHPVTDRITHADFIRVEMDRRIQIKVPVCLDGVPEGVKNEGGVLDFVLRTVELDCLPAQIPEALHVDVSPLHIGQNVTAEDLEVPEGVTVLDPGGTVLATVSVSRAAIAAEAEEEVAAAEAEVEAEGEAPAEDGAEQEKETEASSSDKKKE